MMNQLLKIWKTIRTENQLMNKLYYDAAERLLDESVERVKQGSDIDKEIDALLDHDVVLQYFDRDELKTIFDFELQDPRFFTNIKTETKQ